MKKILIIIALMFAGWGLLIMNVTTFHSLLSYDNAPTRMIFEINRIKEWRLLAKKESTDNEMEIWLNDLALDYCRPVMEKGRLGIWDHVMYNYVVSPVTKIRKYTPRFIVILADYRRQNPIDENYFAATYSTGEWAPYRELIRGCWKKISQDGEKFYAQGHRVNLRESIPIDD